MFFKDGKGSEQATKTDYEIEAVDKEPDFNLKENILQYAKEMTFGQILLSYKNK